jgi:4-amino-4-deoxy-L-arabinose transferase-like glycosyltransferase
VFNVISRTVTPVEGHVGGYFYYFTNFASNENFGYVVLLPFAAALCLFNSVVKRVEQDTLILAWMIIVLATFTLIQTKLYYYILPAFPAFAIAISSLLYQIAKKGYSLFHVFNISCKSFVQRGKQRKVNSLVTQN